MSYTIASIPPTRDPQTRPSSWTTVLEESRRHPGEWRRLAAPMKRSTASQVASDLRCAHRRDPDNMRVAGVLPGDRWETRWARDDADLDPTHFFIWLRFIPLTMVKEQATAW